MPDYLYSVAGKGTSALVQMVMLALLAMRLPPHALATVLSIYASSAIISALGDLGLGTLAARERAYGDPSRADRAIRLGDRIGLTIAGLSILILGFFAIPRPELWACLPLPLWGVLERSTETRSLRLVADHRIARVALLNGGRRALGLCLFVILQLSAPVDWAFSASLALAGLVSQLVMKKWVPLEAAKDTKTTIELLRRALPFALTGVSGQFRNADVPIVTMALGGTAAAAYGLGSRLASPFLLVFSSASSLILVRARSFTRRQVRMLLILLLTGTALLAISLVSASHLLVSPLSNVIPWLTQEETSIIALVASGYLFAGSAIVLGSLCVAFGLQLALVTINVTTTIASLTLVAILSHVTAAGLPPAIASSCCYGLQAFILTLLLFTRRKEGSV